MVRSAILILVIVAISISTEQAQELKGETPTPAQGSPAANSEAAAAKVDYPPDAVTEFSALMIGAMIGGRAQAHVYRSGKLFRSEMPDGTYMLTDLSTRESWAVETEMCVHYEMPSSRSAHFLSLPPGAKIERVAVGQETVEGHPCHVEDITVTIEGEANPRRMRFWEADDLQGFPIKVEWQHIKGKATATFKNVSLEKQDPSLFMRPAKCEQSVGGAMIGKPKPPAKKTRKPKQ